MAIDRRTFLLLAGSGLPLSRFARGGQRAPHLLLGCRQSETGNHYVSAVEPTGVVRFDLLLPGRGHDVSIRPGGEQCAVFARRPGNFLHVVDLINGRVAHEIASPLDRHYYGHGIFSTDGARLYSTENDFATGRGVIGIYDANDNYRRLGEIASHGIGPHELRMLADGKTLVVANGGIRTHPDLGRSKLNLKDMDPLLAYVDSADGALRGSCRPPASHHQLSVRHLAVTNDEAVCIAMQFEGPANIHPPLVAIHRRDQPLKLLLAPPGIQERLRNYCGSVCCDSSGTCFAVSSPRGNLITFWTSAGEYVDCLQLEDGCGIAAHEEPGHFWISSGQGRLVCHSIIEGAKQELRLHPVSATRWDNHLATGLVA